MSGINRDQWLGALRDAGMPHEDDQQAVTIRDFMTMLGLKREAARRRLDALVDAGKAVRTSKREARSNGSAHAAVAYRLLGKKPARKSH